MMRVGLFKPVHVKTLVAQEQRMLLTMTGPTEAAT
jgi:transposase